MIRPTLPTLISTLLACSMGAVALPARADTVVQLPLTGILDARSVTTLTAGQLVVFTLPTDGGNLQNAFATRAVAAQRGKPENNALPNDGRFPASMRHPEVVLHFSNDADPASPQTHLVPPATDVEILLPVATYSRVFFFVNGAAGGTNVTATLHYTDATTDVTKVMVPDYYADLPEGDPLLFNLAQNLAKWDKTTNVNEADHHNITGVMLTPKSLQKQLNGLTLQRDATGNLVLWGATAIATSDVSSAGAGGTSGGGTSGTGGGAGSDGGASGGGGVSAAGGGTGGSTGGGTSTPGGGVGEAASGGALAVSGSTAAGGSTAPTASAPTNGGGCSLSRDSRGAVPWLALLAATALARRRRRA